MFLRLLFVLLLVLNLATGAWMLFGRSVTPRLSATDPGVPELHLLSEQMPAPAPAASVATPVPPAAASSPAPLPAASVAAPMSPAASSSPAPAQSVAATTVSKPPVVGHVCMALGPFATPFDLRRARAALAREIVRSRVRQAQVTEFRGWWVHLPTSPSRAAALAEARTLQAHHITQYFVVGSGEQQNTVSLGLFDDPTNAHRRFAQIVAAGFPARLTHRTGQVPQYWLDIVADRAHVDWRRFVHADGVGSRSTSCF